MIMGTDWKYHLSLIAAVCLWGSSFIGSKIAMQAFSPVFLCLLRFIIASCVLAVMALFHGRFKRPSGKDLKYIFFSGILGISIYYAIENIAVSMTSASDASVISAAYPVITVAVGILFYHLQARRFEIAGILMAVCGVLIMTVSGRREGSSFLGNMMMIFNGFLWAFYNYLTQKISHDTDNFTVTALQVLTGTVGFIPMLMLEDIRIGPLTPAVAGAVGFLSVLCTLAALFLYNYGLRRVSASTAASLMNLMPVAGIALSAAILHETITARHVFGTAVIIGGVLLSAQRYRNQ